MAPAASKPSGSDVALQAAIDGNLGLLKKMAKKVNLREAKDDRGRNALHLVAAKGHLEVCRFLVEELGLDVNSTSAYGSSPLHFAGTEGGESVLRYLVGRGGNPGMPDQALVLKPFDATLFAKRSLCWLRLRDGGRALLDAQFCKILRPRWAKAWYREGTALSSLKNHKGAVDAFAEALKLCPSSKKIEKALRKAKITNPKSKGNEAFEKGHYLIAADYYGEALAIDPFNATLFAKRSLCWLRLRDGDKALLDAQFCKMSRPRWAKAWHREGAALSFSKNHKGALDAFAEALKLDPSSKKIKKSLRKAKASMKTSGGSGELDHGSPGFVR
ncbi:unnamed protein product [Urochloa decumbens]|uniref:Uncharacterized protein n=1 Tax=Urochloa decumbens TaxID=240449 RepID=A0ABC8VHZ5_9POAL